MRRLIALCALAVGVALGAGACSSSSSMISDAAVHDVTVSAVDARPPDAPIIVADVSQLDVPAVDAPAVDVPPSADVPIAPADVTPVLPPDAAVADGALPDVTLIDAFVPTSPDADQRANPLRIRLVDISLDAVGEWLPGGSTNIDPWDMGSGAAIGDLDGDGRLDIVIARNDDPESTGDKHGGPSTILWNVTQPGGSPHFTVDDALAAQLAGVKAHGVALGDYDGDGDLDIFIAASGPDFLFRNDGNGHFTDVTALAGVGGLADDDTAGALWFDANGDGLLDLYVVSYTEASPPFPDDRARNRLFLNLGDGTFADVSAASGTDSDGASQAAAAFDDGDGNLVLYVANDRFCVDGTPGTQPLANLPGDAWLERDSIDDQGVPHFTDHAADKGIIACRSSMGIGIADLDGDGKPDLYVTDIGKKSLYRSSTPGADPLAAAATLGLSAELEPSGFPYVTWGARFLDLDRDGLPELMMVNGSLNRPLLCQDFHQLDLYFRATAPAIPFTDISAAVGLPTTLGCAFSDFPIAGRGLIVGDLDGDGDDDVIISPWNEAYRIYRNDTPRANHYVRLRLAGSVSAPDPAGARVVVTRGDGTKVTAFRVAGGDTYSQSDSPIEVGLGSIESASAVITWPSGMVTDTGPLAIDQELTIVEPEWLHLSARVASASDPAPILTVRTLGTVSATRSDGVPVNFAVGNTVYVAQLPHPGVARRTTVTVTIDGVTYPARPMIVYK